MSEAEQDELEQICAQLEAEVPYDTVSKYMDQDTQSWTDLVLTIQSVWPEAYEAMRRERMGIHGL